VGLLSVVGDDTLFGVLRGHAERGPDQPWLTFERDDGAARTWGYGEFTAEVEATARRLSELGLGPGIGFLVCLDNHPELIRLVLAAAATGSVAIPADTRLTAREVSHYLEVADVQVVFTRADHEPAVVAARERGARIVFVGAPLDGPQRAGRTTAAGDGRGVFELLFTSGTTSRPKGVMLTGRAVVHGARTLAAGAGYTPDDVPLVALPLYHAAAQMHQLWPTLVLGGHAVVVERFAPSRFFGQATRHGATSSAQFAATLRLLLHRGSSTDARAGRLRHMTFAQNLTETELAEWEARFGIPLQQLWGMTETVGLPLMSPLAGDRRLASVGRPVAGYEVVVRDQRGEPTAPGEPGEITVRVKPGENVTLGYYRNEPATTELLRDGWLRSGDMASVDDEGFVYFVGRGRDLIRRAGTNFSALEVEEVVRQVTGVLDVAVVPVHDALGDEAVAAFVVRKGDHPTEDEIRTHCRTALAAFKRPQRIEFLTELPRTAVGKVQKHLLATSPEDRR
jgi:crotonobetaine/carnitine-CoA ligase